MENAKIYNSEDSLVGKEMEGVDKAHSKGFSGGYKRGCSSRNCGEGRSLRSGTGAMVPGRQRS